MQEGHSKCLVMSPNWAMPERDGLIRVKSDDWAENFTSSKTNLRRGESGRSDRDQEPSRIAGNGMRSGKSEDSKEK